MNLMESGDAVNTGIESIYLFEVAICDLKFMVANSDLKVWKVSTEEETSHRLRAVERNDAA